MNEGILIGISGILSFIVGFMLAHIFPIWGKNERSEKQNH